MSHAEYELMQYQRKQLHRSAGPVAPLRVAESEETMARIHDAEHLSDTAKALVDYQTELFRQQIAERDGRVPDDAIFPYRVIYKLSG